MGKSGLTIALWVGLCASAVAQSPVPVMMFVAWSSFFILATFLFGISVAWMKRTRAARD